jgi:translation initiation factor 3 subunit I
MRILESAEPLYVFNPEGSKITVAAWGHNDKYIVCGHEDGSISLMDWKVN